MDAVGWTVLILVAVLLWKSATFRVAAVWGLLALVLLAVPVIAIYPDALDVLPRIAGALIAE